ncbi:MAG TPA: hypothetical protein PLY73_13210 [Candidatus Ozemobacteraceae bacterium]|nr:hypothetical protein [Candidatus Ozemobacteraceae bacterium]
MHHQVGFLFRDPRLVGTEQFLERDHAGVRRHDPFRLLEHLPGLEHVLLVGIDLGQPDRRLEIRRIEEEHVLELERGTRQVAFLVANLPLGQELADVILFLGACAPGAHRSRAERRQESPAPSGKGDEPHQKDTSLPRIASRICTRAPVGKT